MRRLLPFVCVVVVVDTTLYAALTPLLPHFEHTYHLTKSGVGALVASYGVGVLVGAIPGGVIAARRGARTAVLIGLVLVTLRERGRRRGRQLRAARRRPLRPGLRLVADVGGRPGVARARHAAAARSGQALGTAMGAAVFGAVLGPVIGAIASVVGITASFAAIAGLEALLVVVALGIEGARPRAGAGLDDLLRHCATARFCSGSG